MPTSFQSTSPNLWDEASDQYEDISYLGSNKHYPANSYRNEILQEFFAGKPKGKVLDAGCGTGSATRLLLKQGFDVCSIDFSGEMLKRADKLTTEVGLQGKFKKQSVLELEKLEEKFDYVMLNGVLPYISTDDERLVFDGLKKILNPGGYLIASHYNQIFELFGFDSWSVETVGRDFLDNGLLSLQQLADAKSKITSLLKNPEKTLDEYKTMKFENPASYAEKLRQMGFEQFDLAYYNFFYLPPKFEMEQDQKIREKMERQLRRDGRAILLARTFVSLSKRSG